MALQLDTQLLKANVLQLLAEVGVKIENEQLQALMCERGCREAATGRILIPAGLVDDFVQVQQETQASDDDDQLLHPWCGIDWTHWLLWSGQKEQMRQRMQSEFLMSAFDCGPTQYYDYQAGKTVPVDTEILLKMMKFAEATPEIGYISTWYRQDVPQPTERLSSLILALQHTSKVDGIEAIDPRVIKYLVEVSEIMTGETGANCYLAGSQTLLGPLKVDQHAAADMLERHRVGVDRYHIASMPTAGVNTPVTPAAIIVIGAAEILGGLIAAYCLAPDPDADLTGRMISTMMDMRTANASPAGPENIMVDMGVKKLFDDCFGGHLWTEVYFSPSTNHPGFQTVYENFYTAAGNARLSGLSFVPYPGMGTFANGGIGSPTQFMLDMEIRKSQFQLKEEISINEDTLPFDEICQTVANEDDFLQSDHTLDHFRDVWRSELFPPSPSYDLEAASDEERILDECEERWRANVAAWQPPEFPDDKLKALQDLLQRADEELL